MDFQNAFYVWAVEWTELEWMRGFPLISKIQGPTAKNYIRFVQSLPEQEQRFAIGGILRRFHKSALRKAPLSTLESSYLSRYLDQPISPLNGSVQLERIDFRQVLGALRARFPESRIEYSRGSIEMLTPGRTWDLRTTVDVTKSPGRIVYHHDIDKGRQVFLGQWISILGWTGIAGQSEWSEITDASLATETLVQSIEAFAGSSLLKSLNE